MRGCIPFFYPPARKTMRHINRRADGDGLSSELHERSAAGTCTWASPYLFSLLVRLNMNSIYYWVIRGKYQ